jgi:hypothetical protein
VFYEKNKHIAEMAEEEGEELDEESEDKLAAWMYPG